MFPFCKVFAYGWIPGQCWFANALPSYTVEITNESGYSSDNIEHLLFANFILIQTNQIYNWRSLSSITCMLERSKCKVNGTRYFIRNSSLSIEEKIWIPAEALCGYFVPFGDISSSREQSLVKIKLVNSQFCDKRVYRRIYNWKSQWYYWTLQRINGVFIIMRCALFEMWFYYAYDCVMLYSIAVIDVQLDELMSIISYFKQRFSRYYFNLYMCVQAIFWLFHKVTPCCFIL